MRAGMYPMSDTEVYWFVAFDSDGTRVEMTQDEMHADAQRLVKGWKHGIVDCVAATPPGQLSRSRFLDRFPSPLGRLTSLNVTLAGDALHPMTPNMGQVCLRSAPCCAAAPADASLGSLPSDCRRATCSSARVHGLMQGRVLYQLLLHGCRETGGLQGVRWGEGS